MTPTAVAEKWKTVKHIIESYSLTTGCVLWKNTKEHIYKNVGRKLTIQVHLSYCSFSFYSLLHDSQ
jgi:hypothetical protein